MITSTAVLLIAVRHMPPPPQHASDFSGPGGRAASAASRLKSQCHSTLRSSNPAPNCTSSEKSTHARIGQPANRHAPTQACRHTGTHARTHTPHTHPFGRSCPLCGFRLMTSDSPLRGASCLQSAVRLLVIIFQSVTLVSASWLRGRFWKGRGLWLDGCLT